MLFRNMCSTPILIKNPYRSNEIVKDTFNGKGLYIKLPTPYLHDTRSLFLKVPCGQCKQCVSTRQNYYLQRLQMESLYSEMFFFTLTYNDKSLCFTDIGNYNIAYPNYKDIQNMFKRIRKVLPHPFKTFVVSEYGSRRHRPHFHGIICVKKTDIQTFYKGSNSYCELLLSRLFLKEWRRNISKSTKCPVYQNLCDYVRKGNKCTFDFHYICPIRGHDNDVSYYVTKYILKYNSHIVKLLYKISKDSSLSDSETKELISLIKPRCCVSKDLGSYKLPEVSKYIKSCIKKCKDFPSFFDINTGTRMLLSPYYRKRFIDSYERFEQYWDWLHKVQYLDVDYDYNSYEPELIMQLTQTDYNHKSFKSRQDDRKLRKIKNHLQKK